MELKAGNFVIANAGRDKGRCFIVLSVENQYLCLCNGKNRKMSKPKRMKIKHVIDVGCSSDYICDLLSEDKLTDKAVRSAVSEFDSKLKAENKKIGRFYLG